MTEHTPGEDAITVERRSPEETFGLLSNRIRLDVLGAFEDRPDESLSFSELRERVDVADSGRFNYHLQKLLGAFLRRSDEDGGYELTHAGKQMIGAIYAGTYTADATVDPIPVEGECLTCGGQMVAEYGDEAAHVRCVDCDSGSSFLFPPGSLDQFDPGELPVVFDRWIRHLVHRAAAGFCHICAGRMDGQLYLEDDTDQSVPPPARVEYECRRCGSTAVVPVDMLATFHPAVEGFLFERGFDISNDPLSLIWSEVEGPEGRILDDDPLRFEVRLGVGDEAIVVEIDSNGEVTEARRRSVDG